MIQSLLGDVWFYAYAVGFLASLGLFAFLLGQYRAAVQAADHQPDTMQPVLKPVQVEPSGIKKTVLLSAAAVEPVPVTPAPAAAAPLVAPMPAPAAAPAPAPAAKKSEMTTSGLSPAVVYLQNIKSQMDNLDKEIKNLKSLVSKQDSQGDTILKRLDELAEKLKGAPAPSPKSEAPAAVAPPTPATVPSSVPPPRQATQPVPVPIPIPVPGPASASIPTPAPAPTEAPAPAPAPAADKTMADKTVIMAPPLVLEPPPQQESATEAKPPSARKGPVWPI